MSGMILVLDAMGVIYTAADDVAELLVPFVEEKGGIADAEVVAESYRRASLGEINAAAFWKAVKLPATVEDEYLSRHRLSDGLLELLDNLPGGISEVWCLSNDVAEWSLKLRAMHRLEERFAGFVISGDVGVRKPEFGIYERLLETVGRDTQELVFVDDRLKNLDAANLLGFRTVLFGCEESSADEAEHVQVGSFEKLAELLGS